jgi:hypothetical protein
VLPATNAEVWEALPEEWEALPEAVIDALPVAGATVELPAEGVALLDRVALPDGHEGWVLTLTF